MLQGGGVTFSESEERMQYKSWWRDLGEGLCIAALTVLFIQTFLVQSLSVSDPGMAETVVRGDCLLVDRIGHTPYFREWEQALLPRRGIARGQVVLARWDGEDTPRLRRVIGLPGEEVTIQEKRVLINGQPLEESAFPVAHADDQLMLVPPRDFLAPVRLGPGEYFLLGDNRDFARDSRHDGPLPRSRLLARPRWVYWSAALPDETGETPGVPLLNGLTRLLETRWDRICKVIK